MDLSKYTEKAREALLNSQKIAAKNSHQQIDLEHLLTALLEQQNVNWIRFRKSPRQTVRPQATT
jgi:ATP-dependent Clp protease ATP-binding subunit ClpA